MKLKVIIPTIATITTSAAKALKFSALLEVLARLSVLILFRKKLLYNEEKFFVNNFYIFDIYKKGGIIYENY